MYSTQYDSPKISSLSLFSVLKSWDGEGPQLAQAFSESGQEMRL